MPQSLLRLLSLLALSLAGITEPQHPHPVVLEEVHLQYLGTDEPRGSRQRFGYDAEGYRDEATTERLDGGAWIPETLERIAYNDRRFVAKRTSSSWTGSSWEESSQRLISHNRYNYVTEEIRQEWVSGGWLNRERNYSNYDDNNSLVSQGVQFWTGQAWAYGQSSETPPRSSSSSVYTRTDSTTERIEYRWVDGAFLPTRRSWSRASDGGRIQSHLVQTHNGTSWVNQSLTEYTRLAGSEFFTETQTESNWTDGQWSPTQQAVHTSDLKQRTISYQVNHWDGDGWIGAFRHLYRHEGSRLAEVIRKEWRDDSWRERERIRWQYDANGLHIGRTSELRDGDNWLLNIESRWTWSQVTATESITDAQVTALGFYPNPFRSGGTLSLRLPTDGVTEISIHDLTGRVVFKRTERLLAGPSELRINPGPLASGVYLVRVRTPAGTQTLSITHIR